MRFIVLGTALVIAACPSVSHAQASGAYGSLAAAPSRPLFFSTTPDRLTPLNALRPGASALVDGDEPSAHPPRGRLVGAGSAVWYKHKGRTASGEAFDPRKLTAAHRTLPFGARVQVRNRRNGKTVIVRINDRISKKASQRSSLVIDLSHAAAKTLEIDGRAPVTLHLVSGGRP